MFINDNALYQKRIADRLLREIITRRGKFSGGTGCDRAVEAAFTGIFQGLEQRPCPILSLPGGSQIFRDPAQRRRVRWHETRLTALAVDAQVFHPVPLLHVFDPQFA